MTDVFSKEKRSEVMRSIKSKGTGLEKDTAKMLRRAKIHYRSHPKAYGSPDFLVEGRLALFCDGSFWHGRDWKKLRAEAGGRRQPRLLGEAHRVQQEEGQEGQPYAEGAGAAVPEAVGHGREEAAGVVRGKNQEKADGLTMCSRASYSDTPKFLRN